MTKALTALFLVLVLAACGVDGPPSPPPDDRERPEPGVTISGTANVGVAGSSVRARP